jgi:ATP-dependent Clp protease ATP-binding subunit ClpB
MDANRLTQKSQEAFAEVRNIVVSYGHMEIDVEHIVSEVIETHSVCREMKKT